MVRGADAQHCLAVGLLVAAQHGPQARREDARAERLGDVVVGAELETRDDVGLVALGGEHDDGDMPGRGLRPEPPAHLEAVDPGEHQVEDDEIGQTGARRRDRFLPAGDAGHGEALLLEVVLDQFQDVALVVHDEDAFVRHRHHRASRVSNQCIVSLSCEKAVSMGDHG